MKSAALRCAMSMIVSIVAVGKVREAYIRLACEDFRRRLQPYLRVDILEVRASQRRDAAEAIAEEGERIMRAIQPADCVWLLDRRGTQLDSIELSVELERLLREGSRRRLIVCGAFGCSQAVRERADFLWSLSRLTFLHEWTRAIVLEQLYRAAKITRNEPYHH